MDRQEAGSHSPDLTGDERAALSQLKESLRQRFGDRLLKFVIYGSKARGDYDPDSDLDVAIVIRDLTWEEKKQIIEETAEIELNHLAPLSTLILAEEELALLRSRERRLAQDIDKEGIPL